MSLSISNDNRDVKTNTPQGRAIRVDVVNGSSTIDIRGEATCAVDSETLLVSYTVPTGQSFRLKRVLGSGDNKANFIIKRNGVTIATSRTWFTKFNIDVPFDNLSFASDDIVSVHAINRGITVEVFEATILGET
jgi:hypothetical protein